MKSSKPQFVEERGQKVKLNNLCSRGKSSLRQKDVSNDGPYAVYGASGLVGTMASFQNAVPYVAVVKDGAGVGRASACEAKTSVLGTMQALIPSEGIDRDYLLHLVRSLHLGDGFSGSHHSTTSTSRITGSYLFDCIVQLNRSESLTYLPLLSGKSKSQNNNLISLILSSNPGLSKCSETQSKRTDGRASH